MHWSQSLKFHHSRALAQFSHLWKQEWTSHPEDGRYQENKTRVGKDVETLQPMCTGGGDIKWYSCSGKQDNGSWKKSNIEWWDPAIPLSGVSPKMLKEGSQTDTGTPMLIHSSQRIEATQVCTDKWTD